jgi:hypothetical protein
MAKLTLFILLALLMCTLNIRQLSPANRAILYQSPYCASIITRSSPIAWPINIGTMLTNQYCFGPAHKSPVLNNILLFFYSILKMPTCAKEAEQQQKKEEEAMAEAMLRQEKIATM